MKKFFNILMLSSSLMSSAFAALTPLPASMNCNLSSSGLVCQNIPTGMMIAGYSYPDTAGVYTFAKSATIIGDTLMAHYKIDGNSHAGLILGNNRFSNYKIDPNKTAAENPNWQYDDLFKEYECTANADQCGVVLAH